MAVCIHLFSKGLKKRIVIKKCLKHAFKQAFEKHKILIESSVQKAFKTFELCDEASRATSDIWRAGAARPCEVMGANDDVTELWMAARAAAGLPPTRRSPAPAAPRWRSMAAAPAPCAAGAARAPPRP